MSFKPSLPDSFSLSGETAKRSSIVAGIWEHRAWRLPSFRQNRADSRVAPKTVTLGVQATGWEKAASGPAYREFIPDTSSRFRNRTSSRNTGLLYRETRLSPPATEYYPHNPKPERRKRGGFGNRDDVAMRERINAFVVFRRCKYHPCDFLF